MGRAARRPDAWLIVLGSANLIAWSVLAFDGNSLALPAFCSTEMLRAVPLSVSFGLTLVFNSSAQLASGWALMVAAMMSPLLVAPLRHVRDRSFTRRRTRAMLLFVAGYGAVWMIAGVGLQATTLTARWVASAPLVYLGVTAVAILWQISPAKQWCLNRCHRRPHLAAFGAAADRDAFKFGVTNGVSCAGACWALMLPMLLAGQGHVLGMIALALFVFAERLETPSPLEWRWRGPGKAWRIISAQVRIRLAVWTRIGPASHSGGLSKFRGVTTDIA
jgi:predicted metal-binding membrane protein